MYNPLLERQLKKHIGPQWKSLLPEGMEALLQAVSATYDHHTADRDLLERAMEISSLELTEVNNKLREETARQRTLIDKMREFMLQLQVLSGASDVLQAESDDVIVIAEYLAEQIDRCRAAEEELLQSQARLFALIEHTNDFIWSIDTCMTVTGCNSAFRSMFPDTDPRHQSIGMHALDLCVPEERSYWEILYQTVLQGTAFRKEYERNTGNREMYYELSFTPVLVHGIVTGASIYGRDITERKKAEQELEAALRRERELNLLKTRFIGTVSHEFRTPLSGIMMSTELLDRYSTRMTDKERHSEINKIRERVSELTRLMDDVLMQSAADSVHTLYKPMSLHVLELCNTVLDDISSSAPSHTVDASFASDIPMLFADAKLLRYALRNVLSNAIKYSPGHTPVIFRAYHRYDNVYFQISDKGIGIPSEELPLLFNPFFRASNTGTIKGTGLGLSIVKEFIDIHQGEITVDSALGVGTLFTIRLPINQTQHTNQSLA